MQRPQPRWSLSHYQLLEDGWLDGIARQLNPIHGETFRKHPVSYYWSTCQSEWAIDIVFREAADLRRLYPRLVHGMTTFSSLDVMRYLGKRIPLSGEAPKRFSAGTRHRRSASES